jgi:aminoglycoside phosphotransferase (APT) family kinase protein
MSTERPPPAAPADRLIDFAPDRLDRFLRESIADLHGPMSLERISGGQSNPTYFVSYGQRRMVLRKQPSGAVLPSTHAVDREYRIMKALAGTDVPVPKTLLFQPGREVIGTAFYLMERVEGRVFSDPSLGDVESPQERGAMYREMAQVLARLHRVDWHALGLSDFGKAGNYFARQMDRWVKQWHLSKTNEIPELDELAAWLSGRIPADETTVISHGDFRLGNLMFHPREPCVVAVLDWELSTLGHPLADVAYSALAWRLLPTEYMGMRGRNLRHLGIPTEEEYLEHYYRLAPDSGRVEPFHVAFALFRLVVIFAGIASRARKGIAASDDASTVGELSGAFARRGLEVISG